MCVRARLKYRFTQIKLIAVKKTNHTQQKVTTKYLPNYRQYNYIYITTYYNKQIFQKYFNLILILRSYKFFCKNDSNVVS